MCRTLSYVKRLKVNFKSSNVIWRAYMGVVLCHVIFCWPIICDLPKQYFSKIERIDRLATKWASIKDVPPLKARLDNVCIKLIRRISKNIEKHPISEFFERRHVSTNTRRHRPLIPLKRKSKMYGRSFVKFSTFS